MPCPPAPNHTMQSKYHMQLIATAGFASFCTIVLPSSSSINMPQVSVPFGHVTSSLTHGVIRIPLSSKSLRTLQVISCPRDEAVVITPVCHRCGINMVIFGQMAAFTIVPSTCHPIRVTNVHQLWSTDACNRPVAHTSKSSVSPFPRDFPSETIRFRHWSCRHPLSLIA